MLLYFKIKKQERNSTEVQKKIKIRACRCHIFAVFIKKGIEIKKNTFQENFFLHGMDSKLIYMVFFCYGTFLSLLYF